MDEKALQVQCLYTHWELIRNNSTALVEHDCLPLVNKDKTKAAAPATVNEPGTPTTIGIVRDSGGGKLVKELDYDELSTLIGCKPH